MLSLWGTPATASNLAGAHQTWAGVLGACAAALRAGALSWQFVVPPAMEERKGACRAHRVWCEQRKMGRLCLWRQSCVSVPLPISTEFHFLSISFHLLSNAQADGGTWPRLSGFLYSTAELISLTSPKKLVQLLEKHLWLQPCQTVLTKHIFSEPDC